MDFGYVLLCCAHKGDGHSQSIRCFTVEFVLSVRIPILIAIVIALPVAWFSMNAWLSHYAFRTELKAWFFLLPVVLIVLISFLTVAGQTITVIYSKPARSLRYE